MCCAVRQGRATRVLTVRSRTLVHWASAAVMAALSAPEKGGEGPQEAPGCGLSSSVDGSGYAACSNRGKPLAD